MTGGASSAKVNSARNQPRSSPRKWPATGNPWRCRCSSSAAGSTAAALRAKTRNHWLMIVAACGLALRRKRLFFPLLVLGRLGLADGGEQLLDDVLAGVPLGLRLKIRADAVAQHGDSDLLDVV